VKDIVFWVLFATGIWFWGCMAFGWLFVFTRWVVGKYVMPQHHGGGMYLFRQPPKKQPEERN
jgi:hypothetical protein